MEDINVTYKESQTKAKTRQTILSKSLNLFTSNSIESVSLVEIAKVCDITTRNLYRYYPSKEFLVIDCTYFCFYNSQLSNSFELDTSTTGLYQLKSIMISLINLKEDKTEDIGFTKYIMYFDIYISTLSKTHPAFIKYTKEYLPFIEEEDRYPIKSALMCGIKDGTINIKEEEIDLYDTYILQSIFSLLMRINIKEYENKKINESLVYKHIEIILEHLGVNSEN
ncbi:MAG: TetR/AcrR family transcriptional regulator [Spirochaetaceae bacterium]